jgi:hypothetical protein
MKNEECNSVDEIINIAELSKGIYVVEEKLDSTIQSNISALK